MLPANQYIVDREHPAMVKVKVVGFPLRFSKTPCAITRKAPEMGERAEELLVETADYSWEEVPQLREEEVI